VCASFLSMDFSQTSAGLITCFVLLLAVPQMNSLQAFKNMHCVSCLTVGISPVLSRCVSFFDGSTGCETKSLLWMTTIST